jgi:TPR repeat protein
LIRRIFKAGEEMTFRGNTMNYLLDFDLRKDQVEAANMADLNVQVKKLAEMGEGKFYVLESSMVKPEGMNYSFRSVSRSTTALELTDLLKKMQEASRKGGTPELTCDQALALRELKESSGENSDVASLVDAKDFSTMVRQGASLCAARLLFAGGYYARSVKAFEGEKLADDSLYLHDLAWARFYAGDAEGALRDMARFAAARNKSSGMLNGLQAASWIALLQRAGKPVPAELQAYATAIPDGPWPRPLLAMQAGLTTPEALEAQVERMEGDVKELAWVDTQYYLAQRELAQGDKHRAGGRLRMLLARAQFSSPLYWQAKYELWRQFPVSADHQEGARLKGKNDMAGAIAKWRQSADQGSPDSQYRLGWMYYQGEGVKEDHAEALKWFNRAAQQQLPEAFNMLGNMYSDGHGVAKDPVAGIAWFRKAAALGDDWGMTNLAQRLYDGKYVARDVAQAVALRRDAAELHNARAEAELAHHYYIGEGVPRDVSRAVFWGGRAAGKGNAEGQYVLASIYADYAHDRDREWLQKAAELYMAAARQGHELANLQLGKLYLSGKGVEQNQVFGTIHVMAAARKGNVEAVYQLALLQSRGTISKDAAQPYLDLAEKTADEGLVGSQVLMGQLYLDGIARAVDLPKAAAYFRRAAEAGDGLGQVYLAQMLHLGKGMPKDVAEAARWYALAAEQQIALASSNLGGMYEQGVGVPQDYAKALQMYRGAAARNFAAAYVGLGGLYEGGKGVPADPVVAYACFQAAVSNGLDAAKQRRDEAGARLDAEQRKRGDALALEWKRGGIPPGQAAL